MKNQKGVSLIALIITIIVIIILAAIVMGSGGNTISQANYASFAQQFGEYADNVKIDAATVMAETGKNGITINNAQKFYLVANGGKTLTSGDGAFGFQLPVGYVIPKSIKKALNLDLASNDVVAYLIPADNKISGYENKTDLNFYGDSNGKEQHFVTSDGTVFTIPGFMEEQEDGSLKYYVTSQGNHYTVQGKASTTSFTADEADPILTRDFTLLHGVDADSKPQTSATSGEALTFEHDGAAVMYDPATGSETITTALTANAGAIVK